MKPRRPNAVERAREAKAAAAKPDVRITAEDLHNLTVAAKRGLSSFDGQDLVNVSASIARVQGAIAAMQQPAAAPAAPAATPPAPPAEPPKG